MSLESTILRSNCHDAILKRLRASLPILPSQFDNFDRKNSFFWRPRVLLVLKIGSSLFFPENALGSRFLNTSSEEMHLEVQISRTFMFK